MDKAKAKECDKVLDLMRDSEVSIKDLSIRLTELNALGYLSLPEAQAKIKGFLYPEHHVVETQPDQPSWRLRTLRFLRLTD